MRFPFVLLLAGTWALGSLEAPGMFAMYQTKTVPIGRLFTNLQDRLAKSTNDFQLLDDNGDGVVSGAELRGLALWQDANSNGISDRGEVVPVEALGITSISCAGKAHTSGGLWNPAGVTFGNGTSRPTFDWVAPCQESARAVADER